MSIDLKGLKERGFAQINQQILQQAQNSMIPGLTAPRSSGAGIPGFGGGPVQMPGTMMFPGQGGGMDMLANRVYGQPAPPPQAPQGLLALLQSNPNAQRFLGGK